MTFVLALREMLIRNATPLYVLRDFEQRFVKASFTTGWSIHLSSSFVEAAFELGRINTNHRKILQSSLFVSITSHLNNKTYKNEGPAPSVIGAAREAS